MSVFSHPEFDQHQHIAFAHDPASGLKAIIAVHNRQRGPALGGCRMYPYPDDQAALTDVLRLSKGMTYKSALAGLALGGGKSVIIGDPKSAKTPALLRAMGDFINSLGGRYIGAEDSGTSVDDIRLMGEQTDFVAGLDRPGPNGQIRNGDPSPMTAFGVFRGIQAAVKFRLGRDDLDGVRVAIQGVGNVGYHLAGLLHQAGAKLCISDVFTAALERVPGSYQATVVAPENIAQQPVDVFAPCALGAAINDISLAQLQAPIVAGAANNQLATPRHGELLRQRGILYAPDYAINAGGVIDIAHELKGYDPAAAKAHVAGIYETLLEIFARAERANCSTHAVADRMAEERFKV